MAPVTRPCFNPSWKNRAKPAQAGIVLSNGINPLYGKIDPYTMAMNAIDETLHNLTAVGGDVEHAAILDNFCWGSPMDPLQLGLLVRRQGLS
jgi:phosphoribosylformylglycinamidine (FGAM) synthase-like enzyme